jgi:hypothetical protein
MQDYRASWSRRFGATLAQSQDHFSERISVPQASPQNQADFSQNAVSGLDTKHQPLLSSPDSGMIVFSSSARILHMNGPARTLMSLFGTSHEHWPQVAPESLPSIITEFCLDVLAQLRRRVEAQDWTLPSPPSHPQQRIHSLPTRRSLSTHLLITSYRKDRPPSCCRRGLHLDSLAGIMLFASR